MACCERNICNFGLCLTAVSRRTRDAIDGGIIILAAECMNTAMERVVDDISTEKRDAAMQAKDCGSAAVAVTAVGVGVAWVCVIVGLIW